MDLPKEVLEEALFTGRAKIPPVEEDYDYRAWVEQAIQESKAMSPETKQALSPRLRAMLETEARPAYDLHRMLGLR